MPTNRDKIEDYLVRHPNRCDDCISKALYIEPRQQVRQLCCNSKIIFRQIGKCLCCSKHKITNKLRTVHTLSVDRGTQGDPPQPHPNENKNNSKLRVLRVLVISNCTKSKQRSPVLLLRHFLSGKKYVGQRLTILPSISILPAEVMYTGLSHRTLMNGVNYARKNGILIDHRIASAGYGLINSSRSIASYNVTYKGMSAKYLAVLRRIQKMPSAFAAAANTHYDCAIVLLGENYLRECFRGILPHIKLSGPTFLFTTPRIASKHRLANANIRNLKLVLCTPRTLANASPIFMGNNITRTGYIGQRFLQKLVAPPGGLSSSNFIRFLFGLTPPALVLKHI